MKEIITRYLIFLALIIIILIITIYVVKNIDNNDGEICEGIFVVEEGMNASQIANELEREGFVSDSRIFLSVCKIKGLDSRLKVGTYKLSSDMTVFEILDILSKGEVYTLYVTIPEGMRLTRIADILSDEGIIDSERFLFLTNDVERWDRVPAEAKSLEGYLFPDTYELMPDMDEEKVIQLLLDRFFSLIREDIEIDTNNEMSLHQIVTLASIIEKEAMLDEERPLISSVFHNRLEAGMKLQSCATVLYGVGKLDERITIQDLKDDNPYNTYIYTGLPPNPICSPGLKSILSAVSPTETNYLYFVSEGDGSHHFSDNFAEHERYRKRIDRKK